MVLQVTLYNLKAANNSYLLQTILKNRKERNIDIIFIKTRQRQQKKENLQASLIYKPRYKNSKQNVGKLNIVNYKNIINVFINYKCL